jgi:hypothetical protein
MPKYQPRQMRVWGETPPEPQSPPLSAAKRQTAVVTHFMVMSVNADRAILGVGKTPKGVWVRVSEQIFNDISTSIREDERSNGPCSWAAKKVLIRLEV